MQKRSKMSEEPVFKPGSIDQCWTEDESL